jgi:molybdopterin adenylyltransferase
MGAKDHKHSASTTDVTIRVVVVTSSRTEATDETGPAVASRIRAAGLRVSAVDRVDDDEVAIGAMVDQTRDDGAVRCLLLCGGTGLSARDRTVEALTPRLTQLIPGFGELFRSLSYQAIGPAAMLSRALGGLAGDTAVFALPGSPEACALALDRLILPELRHLIHQVDRERGADGAGTPAPSPAAAIAAPAAMPASPGGSSGSSTQVGVGAETIGAQERPPDPDADAPPTGWKLALERLGAKVEDAAWPPLPQAFERMPAARELLETAGQTQVARTKDGRVYTLYGWPDLRRTSSKVLMVGEGEPGPEVVVLHRYPRQVGIAVEDGSGLLPGSDYLPGPIAERLVGAPAPGAGMLYGLDTDAVYTERNGRIYRWDGRKETELGSASQAMASLLLRWSGR